MIFRTEKIIVVDYNPDWPVQFRKFKVLYSSALKGLEVDIQHVGSTSVPGLAAKPVVDMDIIVEDDRTIEHVIKRLDLAGYNHIGHVGLKGREAFKPRSKNVPFANENENAIRHNLYCGKRTNLHIRNHLAIRDYLRKHPKIALEYGNLKKELAQKFPFDIDQYIKYKSPMITRILKSSGFNREEIREIVNLNN